MKLACIAERVIDWNSKRYDQVYNSELAVNLLLEETAELFATNDKVEKLDAVGDIVFVAIGVLWKLGFTANQISNAVHGQAYEQELNIEQASFVDLFNYSKALEYDALEAEEIQDVKGAYMGLNLALYSIFTVALGALQGMALQHEFFNIVHAICDSNDTKEVKGKTDASVKANIVKGAGFVPPTKALEEIIKRNQPVGDNNND